MSLLDNMIFGYRKIVGAVEAVMRDTIQFVGATVADDPVTKRTVVTIPTVTGLPDAEVGDMVYRGTAGWETLSAGDEGQVLTMPVGGDTPRWDDPSGGELPAGEVGDILYHDGTGWATLSKGDPGDVLMMPVGTSTPRWDGPSGGESRWDWEDSIDHMSAGGAATHDLTTPLPIPETPGSYHVEVHAVLTQTDEGGMAGGYGATVAPLHFTVRRCTNGTIVGAGGSTDFASYWPGVSIAVLTDTSANVGSIGVAMHVDSDCYLRITATYGGTGETFRWTARATIEGIAVSA